jgi:protein tyrosine/serine phosphatase
MNDSRLPQKSKPISKGIIFSLVLSMLLLLIGGAWLWWHENHFVPRRFGVVEQGHIYRSGQISSSLIKEILVKYKIGVVVSLSADSENNADKIAEKQTAAELGIEREVFPLSGNGIGDINNYAGAIAAIYRAQKEQKPVLIHCDTGAQRTGGVVAAYQLLVRKKDASSVVREMMRYGWNQKRNPALLPYLNDNMKELSALLLKMGVIDSMPSPLPRIVVAD